MNPPSIPARASPGQWIPPSITPERLASGSRRAFHQSCPPVHFQSSSNVFNLTKLPNFTAPELPLSLPVNSAGGRILLTLISDFPMRFAMQFSVHLPYAISVLHFTMHFFMRFPSAIPLCISLCIFVCLPYVTSLRISLCISMCTFRMQFPQMFRNAFLCAVELCRTQRFYRKIPSQCRRFVSGGVPGFMLGVTSGVVSRVVLGICRGFVRGCVGGYVGSMSGVCRGLCRENVGVCLGGRVEDIVGSMSGACQGSEGSEASRSIRKVPEAGCQRFLGGLRRNCPGEIS